MQLHLQLRIDRSAHQTKAIELLLSKGREHRRLVHLDRSEYLQMTSLHEELLEIGIIVGSISQDMREMMKERSRAVPRLVDYHRC